MNPQERLQKAIISGDQQEFEQAIALKADVNYLYPRISGTRMGDLVNIHPLHLAIVCRKPELAERLVELGANPSNHFNGCSAVNVAIEYRMLPLIRAMHKAGANLDQMDDFNFCPLTVAINYGDSEMFDLLLELGASINPADTDMSPLEKLNHETLPFTRRLLDKGADTQPRDSRGTIRPLNSEVQKVITESRAVLSQMFDEMPEKGVNETLFVDHGKPPARLLLILGQHRLPELFAPKQWKGNEREAAQFFKQIKAATPAHYRQQLAQIDLSALNETALGNPGTSAVERFKRSKKIARELGS